MMKFEGIVFLLDIQMEYEASEDWILDLNQI